MVIEDGPARTTRRRTRASLALRGRDLRRLGHDPHELAALQKFPALAAAARRAVLRRRDRLLGAPRRLDREEIAVARGRDEAQQPVVVLLQLDQDHASAGPRQ